MPFVTNGGTTITVHLKHGVRFSPPVNSESPADVKYAIERGFATSVSNGYVGAYFGGSSARQATKGVPNIAASGRPTSSRSCSG
jgi:peptide/nickel transport system substrate-binding protein